MTTATGKATGAGLQVQRFSPLSSWWEQNSTQADMVLDRSLYLDPQAARRREILGLVGLSI